MNNTALLISGSDQVSNNQLYLPQILKFFESLNAPASADELNEILCRAHIAEQDVKEWIKFDSEIYSRNRIALFPQIEILLMCWKSGQTTPIHDHKGSACGLKVINGTASEISYQTSKSGALVPTGYERFFEKEVATCADEDIHQFGNLEGPDSDLITLHCYSPPLIKMQLFNVDQTFLNGYDFLYESVTLRTQKASLKVQ